MAIYHLHSKRQKRLRGDVPDVYIYDDFPVGLRNQIVHIWRDTVGDDSDSAHFYRGMGDIVAREYGLESFPVLAKYARSGVVQNFFAVFTASENFDLVSDITELSFRGIRSLSEEGYRLTHQEYLDAIDELNSRFQEHGVGYQFLNDELVRVDSQLIHSEVVKPALSLLNSKGYAGAQQEFLLAHEHYRKGNGKEAMTECAKSLESVMKSICDRRGWPYDKNAAAKQLIKICFDRGLVPLFWETHFSHLRSMLEVSVPVGRNKISAHGQGTKPIEVPDYLVAYMLHMTASTIVFLAEAEVAL